MSSARSSQFAIVACTSLGTQTPIRDIARAAAAQGADVVALSFSLAYPVTQAIEGLAELRAQLDPAVEIWAGGANPGLVRRAVEGVHAIPELAAVPTAVARWRASRGGTRSGPAARSARTSEANSRPPRAA